MTNYPNITINLYDPYPIRVLNIKQYDTGRGAMVTLTGLGGEVITPTGNGLYVLAKKRDGNIVYNTVTLVGNQIKIDFDEQMTVLSGLLQVEIQMIDAQGKTISTPIFAVNVMPSNINPLQIESTSEFGALTDALADVENLKQNGLKGDPGDAATIQVGTVTATDPGGNPAVTNSGTEQDAVLDFTLPRGEPGSIWYQGSAITGANTSGTVFTGSGIANAELNDMYLNTGSGTDKGNVYVCVLAGDANTAKWAYKQNIMGPTGPAGTANASSVAYNNESSGLTAGNVQGALDELTNKVIKKTYTNITTDSYGFFGISELQSDISNGYSIISAFAKDAAFDQNGTNAFPVFTVNNAGGVSPYGYLYKASGSNITVLSGALNVTMVVILAKL